MKSHNLSISVPGEIINEAKKAGMKEKEIKKMVETFNMLQLASFLSKLTKEDARELSRKINT